MDEFSRYERWYGRDEPPTARRLAPGGAFLPSSALRDLRELAGRQVEALAVRTGGSLAVLVANLTPARQRCRIAALPARSVAVRRPDVHACTEPAAFRATAPPLDGCDGNAPTLELTQFAYAWVHISL